MRGGRVFDMHSCAVLMNVKVAKTIFSFLKIDPSRLSKHCYKHRPIPVRQNRTS